MGGGVELVDADPARKGVAGGGLRRERPAQVRELDGRVAMQGEVKLDKGGPAYFSVMSRQNSEVATPRSLSRNCASASWSTPSCIRDWHRGRPSSSQIRSGRSPGEQQAQQPGEHACPVQSTEVEEGGGCQGGECCQHYHRSWVLRRAPGPGIDSQKTTTARMISALWMTVFGPMISLQPRIDGLHALRRCAAVVSQRSARGAAVPSRSRHGPPFGWFSDAAVRRVWSKSVRRGRASSKALVVEGKGEQLPEQAGSLSKGPTPRHRRRCWL